MSIFLSREIAYVDDARPHSSDSSPTINRALIVGIDTYGGADLNNAKRDAVAMARLLERDYGFDLVGSAPILDETATLTRLDLELENLFAGMTSEDQCLLYFAGHGKVVDNGGILMLTDSPETGPDTGWSLTNLVQRFRESPARGLLIIDACYSGRALHETGSGLDLGKEARLGSIHLLAAGDPWQSVLDGPRGEHSPFTSSLLSILDGRAGLHDADGKIPVSRLADHLPTIAEEHLERLAQRGNYPFRPTQVVAAELRPSDSGRPGQFLFMPSSRRLSPQLVQGLRESIREPDLGMRRTLVRQLVDEVEGLRDDIGSQSKALLVAFDLCLEGFELPAGDPAGEIRNQSSEPTPLKLGPEREKEGLDARRETTLALDRLAKCAIRISETANEAPEVEALDLEHIEGYLETARIALIELAAFDTDPIVRHAARRGARRLLPLFSEAPIRGLADQAGSQGTRWKLLHFYLDHHRGARVPAWHLVSFSAGLIDAARRTWRARWPRRIVLWSSSIPLLLHLVVLCTYHFDTDPTGWIVAKWGPPGFEALLGAGSVAMHTGWHENSLSSRRLPRNPPPWGWWLAPGGWMSQLGDLSGSERAVATHYRLGDDESAWDRLDAWAREGQDDALKWAAYLTLQNPEYEPRLLDLASIFLDRPRDEKARVGALEILGRWCSAARIDPEKFPDSSDLHRACVGSSSARKATESSLKASPVDWRARLEELGHHDELVRSEAVGHLFTAVATRSLSPDEENLISHALGPILADSHPWNRLGAADTILFLGSAPEPIYQRAFRTLADGIAEEENFMAGQKLVGRMDSASARSKKRFLRQWARHLAELGQKPFELYPVGAVLEGISDSLFRDDPRYLDEIVEAWLPLFDTVNLDRDFHFLLRSRVKNYMKRVVKQVPEAGSELVEMLLHLFDEGDLAQQKTATWLLGSTLGHGLAIDRTASRLERAVRLPGTDQGIAVGAAYSLLETRGMHPDWAQRAQDAYLEALSRPATLQNRIALTTCLRWIAASTSPPVRHLPTVLHLATDPEPSIRVNATAALMSWASQIPLVHTDLEAWVRRRLDNEEDSEVRANLIAARGLALGGKAGRTAIEELVELHDDGQTDALFHAAHIVSVHSELAPGLVHAIESRWAHDQILGIQGMIAVLFRAASENPILARDLVGGILTEMLLEQPSRVGRYVLDNGIKPLARYNPSLRPLVMARLDSFVTAIEMGEIEPESPEQRLGLLLDEVSKAWIELAYQELQAHPEWPGWLERRGRSKSGWQRRTASALMRRIALEQPRQRTELRALLENLREYRWRPEVRTSAARSLELLRLIEIKEQLDIGRQQDLVALLDSIDTIDSADLGPIGEANRAPSALMM